MGVPGSFRSVFGKDIGETVRVLTGIGDTAQSSMKEMGFPSPFIDIIMLRPDCGHSKTPIDHPCRRFDDGVQIAEIAHQRAKFLEFSQLPLWFIAGEFDRQQRSGSSCTNFSMVGRNMGMSLVLVAIDQLDSGRIQLHDMLRRFRCAVKVGK